MDVTAELETLKSSLDTLGVGLEGIADEIRDNLIETLEAYLEGDLSQEDAKKIVSDYGQAIQSRIASGAVQLQSDAQDQIASICSTALKIAMVTL